jgi:hypothetical protein
MADYTTQVSPRKVMESVNRGMKRLSNFRQARIMFLRNYVGQYYDKEKGNIGDEPLNLIFNAIRVLVPNIVLSFPKHNIHTPYLSAKQYVEISAWRWTSTTSRSTSRHLPGGHRRCDLHPRHL